MTERKVMIRIQWAGHVGRMAEELDREKGEIRLQWAGHVGRMAEELDREKGDDQTTVGRTRRMDGRGA